MPVLFRYGDIIVYNKAKKVVSTYPAGQAVLYRKYKRKRSVNCMVKGTFSIHIEELIHHYYLFYIMGNFIFRILYDSFYRNTIYYIPQFVA